MTRIIIFTPEEKKSFNSPPLFNSLDRKKYFSFSTGILDIAGHLTKPENRIFFLVTYEYFKATHKFYNKRLHIKDIVYVADKIGFKKETLSTATYNIRSYSDHKKMILAYLGYKKFDREAARLVSSHMDSFLRSHARPKVMLQQAYEMLVKQKIENPSYNTLMTIISSEMKNHQKILTDTLQKCITKERKMLLDTLIHKKGNRYCLTLLKRFSQSTKPSRIKENMEDLKILRDLFQQVESLVDTVQLTNEGLRYYAYATIKSRIL